MELLGPTLIWPDIGVLLKVCPLGPYNTESLARWRLHYPPSLYFGNALRTKLFKSNDLSLDVVCFYIQVNSAFVPHRLNKNFHLARRAFKHSIRL